jgi:hypothetical protein
MGYVAFSRATTLAGICLIGYHYKALLVDPYIVDHDIKFLKQSQDNE